MSLATWFTIAALGPLMGCALSSSHSERSLFALAASDPRDPVPAGSWDVVVGLGPVAIPGYLERPQLVTRVGPNELDLKRDARWAEPLRDGVARALQQDLAAASGARQVPLYPWPMATRVDLAVAVDVLRFEPSARGEVELGARWNVRETARGHVLVARQSQFAEPVEGRGSEAEVAALSRALGHLAEEIAAALREVKIPAR